MSPKPAIQNQATEERQAIDTLYAEGLRLMGVNKDEALKHFNYAVALSIEILIKPRQSFSGNIIDNIRNILWQCLLKQIEVLLSLGRHKEALIIFVELVSKKEQYPGFPKELIARLQATINNGFVDQKTSAAAIASTAALQDPHPPKRDAKQLTYGQALYADLGQRYRQLKILKKNNIIKVRENLYKQIIAGLKEFTNPSRNILRLLRDAYVGLGELYLELKDHKQAYNAFRAAQSNQRRIEGKNWNRADRIVAPKIKAQLAVLTSGMAVGAAATYPPVVARTHVTIRNMQASSAFDQKTVPKNERQLLEEIDLFNQEVCTLREECAPAVDILPCYAAILEKLQGLTNPSDKIKRHLRNIYMDGGDLYLFGLEQKGQAKEMYDRARFWDEQISFKYEVTDPYFNSLLSLM